MALSDRRRKALFLLALGVLVAWGGAVALLGRGAGGPDAAAETGPRPGPRTLARRPAGGPTHQAAADAALRFLAAYLVYERGASTPGDRRILARLSTPGFGGQLLGAPVLRPAAGGAPREWISRAAGVRVGIFEGRQTLMVSVVVVGTGGAHVLTPTLVRSGGGWLVAGIGE